MSKAMPGVRPSLRKWRIRAVRLGCELSVPAHAFQALRDLASVDKDGDYVFAKEFPWGGGIAIVSATDTDSSEVDNRALVVSFVFRHGAVYRDERTGSLDAFVSWLQALSLEGNLACQILYAYPRRSKLRPIVELPCAVPGSSSAPFDAVEGIRVVRREGRKMQYSAVIDLQSNGGFAVNLSFGLRTPLDHNIVDNVIQAGNVYVSSLTREATQ